MGLCKTIALGVNLVVRTIYKAGYYQAILNERRKRDEGELWRLWYVWELENR